MADANDRKAGGVQSLAAACDLLGLIAESEEPTRVTEMATALGMTKARVSRHLSTLVELGMVRRTPEGRGFRLGWRMMQLGQRAVEHYHVAAVAEPFLRRLRDEIDEAVLVAIPANGDALISKSMRSRKPISPYLVPGQRLRAPDSPTCCVLWAFAQHTDVRKEISAYLAGDNTCRIQDVDRFLRMLDRIRADYHAWEPDPHGAGFSSVAAPLFGHAGNIEGAIAMVRPGPSTAPDMTSLEALKRSASDISRALGSTRWNEF